MDDVERVKLMARAAAMLQVASGAMFTRHGRDKKTDTVRFSLVFEVPVGVIQKSKATGDGFFNDGGHEFKLEPGRLSELDRAAAEAVGVRLKEAVSEWEAEQDKRWRVEEELRTAGIMRTAGDLKVEAENELDADWDQRAKEALALDLSEIDV